MEPSIYKPSIYKGAGIYKNGAEGNIPEQIEIDGKNYGVVKIGNQLWINENLDVLTPNRKYYNNNSSYFSPLNGGGLYKIDEFELITSKLPAGWHIPSYDEWQELFNSVGGVSIAAKKLKSINYGGENYNGFNAVCAGNYRISNQTFWDGGTIGFYWTSTPATGGKYYYRALLKVNDNATENESVSGLQYSIRVVYNI